MKEIVANAVMIAGNLSYLILPVLIVAWSGRRLAGILFSVVWYPVAYLAISCFQTYVAENWQIGWQKADVIGLLPMLVIAAPFGALLSGVGEKIYKAAHKAQPVGGNEAQLAGFCRELLASEDLPNAKWMYAKAALFLMIGATSFWLLLIGGDLDTGRRAVLQVLMIWAFARAYYFAFYVIEHYVDRRFRFSGLFDFFLYVIGLRRKTEAWRAEGGTGEGASSQR